MTVRVWSAGGPVGRLLRLVVLFGLLVGPTQSRAQRTGTSLIEEQVADAFCNKKIVVLGELPSHGEARAFQAKARIVERLVNQCGFDAVLFEAPIYDFLGLQEAMAENRAVLAQLNRAIGGFWVTRDLSAWRRWLFDQATHGKLLLGGLDDQISATSDYARATLPDLVARSVPAESASECRQAVARNLNWRYGAEQQLDEAERIRLQRCARVAAGGLAKGSDPPVEAIERVILENLASLYDRQRNGAEPDRDEVMFRNLRWHAERMPAASKFVVWTATVHAARQQGERQSKPLGTWLSEQWGDRLAVLGFSAFTGRSSIAGRPSQPLLEAPPGSLEALTTTPDTAWVYLNANALRQIGVVPSRLFGTFTSADWSVLFDGVLVIREETAPVFEPK